MRLQWLWYQKSSNEQSLINFGWIKLSLRQWSKVDSWTAKNTKLIFIVSLVMIRFFPLMDFIFFVVLSFTLFFFPLISADVAVDILKILYYKSEGFITIHLSSLSCIALWSSCMQEHCFQELSLSLLNKDMSFLADIWFRTNKITSAYVCRSTTETAVLVDYILVFRVDLCYQSTNTSCFNYS